MAFFFRAIGRVIDLESRPKICSIINVPRIDGPVCECERFFGARKVFSEERFQEVTCRSLRVRSVPLFVFESCYKSTGALVARNIVFTTFVSLLFIANHLPAYCVSLNEIILDTDSAVFTL